MSLDTQHISMQRRMRSSVYLQQPQQCGFTLVEVMIALALGLVLISGLVTVFQGNKQSSELNQAMAEMQESARFALDALTRDARMAGFQGCALASDSSAKVIASDAPTDNLNLSALTGSRIIGTKNWDPPPPLTFTIPTAGIEPVVGSDVLSLQFGNQEIFNVLPMPNAGADIVLSEAPTTIEAGDLLLVGNCQVADLFRATAVNDATIKHGSLLNQGTANLSIAYGQGGANNLSMLTKFEANVYFLANTGRKNKSGDEIISLYRQTLPFDQPPQEMIEGVEQFRIKYGIREEGTNSIMWGNASDVAGDFDRVHSLQIGLLMSSYERLAPAADNKSYIVAGDLVMPSQSTGAAGDPTHAGDRRFRLAFNTTINIRNRR